MKPLDGHFGDVYFTYFTFGEMAGKREINVKSTINS